MRAVFFAGKGGPEIIELREVAAPEPPPRHVLVRVRSAGLNRADLLQRRGLYPPPPGTRPEIPGLEFAGEVIGGAPDASRWKIGDRVMAIAAGEAQAELVAAHEDMLCAVPSGIDFEAAGAIPEAFITAHDALDSLGGLRGGQIVLVHAAGSGVGTAAIQLTKAAGARVIGTARSAEKLERARSLGLDDGVLVAREQPRFADAVRAANGGRGVDLVLDFVGASYLAENIAALAEEGRLVVVGLLGGASAPLDLGTLLRKRLTVIGTVLRSRPLDQKITATRAFADGALPLFDSGKARPVVDRTFRFAEASEAHRYLEQNESFGKVTLLP
jgi:putative PIG3 family NAD(P)H quinone oxidoreductase